MKLTILAVSSLFMGFLSAQTNQISRQPDQRDMAATTNVDGTLVDQGCHSTHSRRTETTTNPDNSTTTTEITHVVTECPVTTTTTSFGVMTPDGRYLRLDDGGNTRVVEMIRSNPNWGDEIRDHRPVRVRIIGTENGDVIMIRDIR